MAVLRDGAGQLWRLDSSGQNPITPEQMFYTSNALYAAYRPPVQPGRYGAGKQGDGAGASSAKSVVVFEELDSRQNGGTTRPRQAV